MSLLSTWFSLFHFSLALMEESSSAMNLSTITWCLHNQTCICNTASGSIAPEVLLGSNVLKQSCSPSTVCVVCQHLQNAHPFDSMLFAIVVHCLDPMTRACPDWLFLLRPDPFCCHPMSALPQFHRSFFCGHRSHSLLLSLSTACIIKRGFHFRTNFSSVISSAKSCVTGLVVSLSIFFE